MHSDDSAAGKGQVFASAMLREIYEQPGALVATLEAYVSRGQLRTEAFAPAMAALGRHERIVIAASGSSRHAGLAGEILLEDFAGVAVDVEYASEYSYRTTQTIHDPAVIVLSQSGETADTLAALREATSRALDTVAVTNKPASTMAREALASLPTLAGIEEAIPATKSFTTQLMVLYLLAISLARQRGRISSEVAEVRCQQALDLVPLLERWIPVWDQQVRHLAERCAAAQTFLYLGRGIHYPIAREGALKMKESSYVHAEGYPTGELKHGPNALVSGKVPLVVLATRDAEDPNSMLRYSKSLQLLRDMKAQGAQTLVIATEGDDEIAQAATDTIFVPPASEYLLPVLEVVPLQLLAYHVAIFNGVDVDRPRNLVKAVVEE